MALKYGFHNKSFILNAPLVSLVIGSGWVQQQTHPKQMTGIGQLTRRSFRIGLVMKFDPKFIFHYVLLNSKTEGILPLSSCPLCDAAAYIETFFLHSAWHSQSLEAKLQMKCCYLVKGYVHKQQFCCPWTRYEIKVVVLALNE